MKLAEILDILAKQIEDYKKESLEKFNYWNLEPHLVFYIYSLGHLEHPTYGELAKHLNVSKPAVTAIINKLISHDLVYKEQSDDDKRIFYVNLTEKGNEIFDSCKIAFLKLEEFIAAKLTDEEYKQLIELLTIIIK